MNNLPPWQILGEPTTATPVVVAIGAEKAEEVSKMGRGEQFEQGERGVWAVSPGN
jgi:hypothetical protein